MANLCTCATVVGASSLYWMAIEYNMGLVAGSLPGLRPLFARFGIFGTTNDATGRSSRKNPQFSPSYQLEDHSSKNWGPGRRAKGSKNRYQGESVLDATVVGGRSSRESDEAGIVKTQVFTVSHEYENNSVKDKQQSWSNLNGK